VVDQQGAPLPGVDVEVRYQLDRRSTNKRQTDQAGTIRLKPPAKDFTLVFSKDKLGLRMASTEVPKLGPIRVELEEMATIKGRVLLDGIPVSATVFLRSGEGLTFFSDPISVRSKSDGTFVQRVPSNRDHTYRISFYIRGKNLERGVQSLAKIVSGEQTDIGDVNLHQIDRSRTLNGTARDSDGNPVRTRVTAYESGPKRGPLLTSASSDADGDFQLLRLPAGKKLSIVARGPHGMTVTEVAADADFVKIVIP